MRTIHKSSVPIFDELTLGLPKNSTILCLQMQGNTPCIWYTCDHDVDYIDRRFVWRGTGHPMPEDVENLRYVGTIQIAASGLVFHLFERTN